MAKNSPYAYDSCTGLKRLKCSHLFLLFGGHPNRVCEIAYVDPTAVSCNRHTIRANVNKSSDVNVCHVNDSYKVHNLPFFTVQIFHWAVSTFPLRGRIFAHKR